MLRQLWKGLSTKTSARTAARRAPRRLALEALEDRCVPTAYTWIGPGGGLWSNPANWSSAQPGTVPGVGSDVVYNTATSSIDDLTIPSPGLNSLLIGTSAGLLNIKGSLQQAPGTFINQEGGVVAVSGSFANGGGYNQFAGAMGVIGVLSNTGVYDLFAGSLIGPGQFVNGAPGQQGALLINAPGGANLGVNLANYDTIDWQAGAISLGGVLTNTSTGAINITAANTMSGPGYLVNNDGGTVTLNTPGGAFLTSIDVAFGPSNVNYGTIDVEDGSLVLGTVGSTVAFTNEGTIQYSGSNTGCVIAFNATFEQLPNAQNSSVIPQVTGTAGNALYFAQGGIFNAGFMIVNGVGAFTGPNTGNDDLVVEQNADVQVGGVLVVNNIIGVGGTVEFSPVAPAGATIVGTVFINKGELETDAQTVFTNTLNGNVYNVGTLSVEADSNLVINGSLIQGGQATTSVYGFSSFSTLVVKQYIVVDGGIFHADENSAVTATHGLFVEPSGTLQFDFGNATVNGNVYILGTLKTLFESNGTFTGSVVFGGTSTVATITMEINSTVNFDGATDFANASLSFGFIPSTPAVYTPLLFNGAVSGTPTVTLPAGDTWSLSATELQVTVP